MRRLSSSTVHGPLLSSSSTKSSSLQLLALFVMVDMKDMILASQKKRRRKKNKIKEPNFMLSEEKTAKASYIGLRKG